MLPDYLRQHAQKIAQHEMGHYVVSRLLGFRTGDVTLELLGATLEHSGGAETKLPARIATFADLGSYLDRRIQILFAGVQAQTLNPALPDTIDNDAAIELSRSPTSGAKDDFSKARELIHILRSIRHPDTDPNDWDSCDRELAQIENAIWNKTAELVQNHAKTIVGLAGNLAARVEKTKAQYRITASELEQLEAVRSLTD